MAHIRELIGVSVRASDLRMSATEERAIDRVAALASTSSLGASILRLRYGHDAHAYRPIRKAIVRRISLRSGSGPQYKFRQAQPDRHSDARKDEPDPAIVDRLAARVLLELVDDQCEHCHGRTWVQRGSARQPCRTCSATGKRIPRDIDRAQALGLPVEVYLRHWARRLERMLDTLRGADARAARRLQIDLERRMVSPPTKSQPAQSSAPRSPLEPKNMGVRHEGIARPQESESPQAEAAGFCV
jgi:hypothetical protein